MPLFTRVTGPAKLNGFRVITSPKLGERMFNGLRGPMERGHWPLTCMVDGVAITNSRVMRNDYSPIGAIEEGKIADNDLAKGLIEESQNTNKAFIVLRTNIPMNYGVAWCEGGTWYKHARDYVSKTVPVIQLSKEHMDISASTYRIDNMYNTQDTYILTPCYGLSSVAMNVDLLIRGTYDPRHLVGGQYAWKEKADHPDNIRLTNLSALFNDPTSYAEACKKIIFKDPQNPAWGHYNRTVLVTSLDHGQPFEVYSFLDKNAEVSAPKVFEEVMNSTKIKNPVIFGMVEGGSFGVGLVHDGQFTNLGKAEDYFRGAEGMWLLALEIDKPEANRIINEHKG